MALPAGALLAQAAAVAAFGPAGAAFSGIVLAAFGPPQVAVTIAGIALAALVIWYFLVSPRAVTATAQTRGATQEVTMVVKGGYTPNTLVLKQGVPARLIVDRQETGECSEELVIPGVLSRKQFLPPFERTVVEFTPEKKGEFTITCGMGMLHGKLIVT